ncbi:MAG: nucleotidyltransferase domain-containing protein [Ruminococcus sp.]
MIILFGARARGDFKRTSDIDLAVSGGDFADLRWM